MTARKPRIVWTYFVFVDVKMHITTWREMYRNLRDRFDINFIFPFEDEPRGFTEKIEYISVPRLPYLKKLVYFMKIWRVYRRLLRTWQPDILIVDGWTWFLSLAHLGKETHPKVILDSRAPLYNQSGRYGRFISLILKGYADFVLRFNRHSHDGLSCISDALVDLYLDQFRTPLHDNLVTWPSGVDISRFKPIRSKEFPDPEHLFFHGNITPNRGLQGVIRALSALRQAGRRMHFEILGEGYFQPELEHLVRVLELEEQVSFHPSIPFDQIPARIAAAGICMMTYPVIEYWEGNIPIKMLEYMAMNKPVLCTPLKAFRTMAGPCRNVHFTRGDSVEEIAEGILEICEHPARFLEDESTLRKHLESNFTWTSVAARFGNFLLETIGRTDA